MALLPQSLKISYGLFENFLSSVEITSSLDRSIYSFLKEIDEVHDVLKIDVFLVRTIFFAHKA